MLSSRITNGVQESYEIARFLLTDRRRAGIPHRTELLDRDTSHSRSFGLIGVSSTCRVHVGIVDARNFFRRGRQ